MVTVEKYFGVIFNKAPTYYDIVLDKPDCTKITGVNSIFVPKNFSPGLMAEHVGQESLRAV